MNVALAYRACLLEVNLWTCVMVGWYGAVACHEHVLTASRKIFRIPDPSMELSMIPVSFFFGIRFYHIGTFCNYLYEKICTYVVVVTK